jgi:hypothetical protein
MIHPPAAIALQVLALSAVLAVAQPKAGDVQPDRIPFGVVYAGAIVEGSSQVFEPGNDADIPLTANAPKFVTVRHKATHAQQFGPGNDFIVGSVEFALDTSTAGDLSGEFSVQLGEADMKVPVSDGFVAQAKAGKGEVIALGESLWWNWIMETRAAGTDNARLLRWLVGPPKGK